MQQKKKEITKKENAPATLKELSKLNIKTWLEIIASALAIGCVIFSIGYWVAGIEHKVEIMNLNQRHNHEMSELRIQMNNKVQAIQNKYDILELNYNSLKERKEERHEK